MFKYKNIKIILIAFTFCLILITKFSLGKNENTIITIHSYLPDGTQVKIIKDKAYYYCRGKFILLPDEAYMLSDGSLLTIKNGKIVELILTN